MPCIRLRSTAGGPYLQPARREAAATAGQHGGAAVPSGSVIGEFMHSLVPVFQQVLLEIQNAQHSTANHKSSFQMAAPGRCWETKSLH